MPDPYLMIGEITKPQGIKGEIKARPVTCDPERFMGLETVYLLKKGEYVPRRIEVRSATDEAVFFEMEGVSSREEAEALRGERLYIDRAHAVELGEDENFVVDLLGCNVTDTWGRALGTVKDVLQPGGNDVYVIEGGLGEILVPAIKSAVLSVDIEKKTMLLDADRLKEVAVFSDSEEIR